MANLLSYPNTQIIKNSAVVGTVDLKVAVSTTATAAWNRYRGYNQSNIFQVGSWTQGGVGGSTVFTLNNNWKTVCADFGINPKYISMIVESTSNYAPTAGQKLDFWDNMVYNFPKAVNYTNQADLSVTYNNVNHGIYASGYGQVSNFRRYASIPVYDAATNHWYTVGFEYRTDNFNPGKVWLVTVDPYNQNTMMPTSGVPIVNTANPYPNIPDTEPEGGEGSGDFSGDSISEPSLPSKSAMGSGLVQLYNPTVSQLRSFGQWLWNANGFDLNDLKRVFNDPMDMIIGLSIFPVTPTVSETPDTIKLGNIDSEVSSNVLSSQFKRIDLGTINLEEVYNSYLDYAPYTKVQIFLPFIGIRDLDCDDVMGKAIHLTYSVDMLSGACVAHVLVNGSTMYEYGGSCNEQVPLTARDLTTIFSGIASVVATGAGAVAAISAGIAALPAEASAGAVLGTAGVGVTGAGASIARNVISSKPSVEHASGIGGTTGYLSCKKPYLIVQRPRLCHPANQEHFTGYPGFIYVSALSQLEGFTKMVNVELTRIHATDAELEEIAEWLMSKGVRI